jgi:hypothetical protein
MTEDRRSAQPLSTHELAGCVELLRGAPIQLATNYLRCAQDTCRARAGSTSQRDTPERVGQSPHLFMSRRVNQLRLRDRLAATHDAAGASVVEHLARI